jgi:hypothetical protein
VQQNEEKAISNHFSSQADTPTFRVSAKKYDGS